VSRPEPRSNVLARLHELAVHAGALVQRRPVPAPPQGVDAEDLSAGYEHGDMNALAIGGAAVGLLIVLFLVLLGVTAFEQVVTGIPFQVSRPEDLVSGLQVADAPTPPAPALEAKSGQTLDPYRAAQQQQLNSYGWTDRSVGTIHIPIDRAIDLTAQRGLPARPAALAAPQDSGATSPSDASSGRVAESYP
jgi:hypothetical protein